MKLKLIRDDTRGATLVEFSVTLPFFLLLTFGLVQAGLLLWTQLGLQHGVEMAARCASVNYSANQIGLNESCFTAFFKDADVNPVKPSEVIADPTYIEKYAAQNSYGLNLPHDTFTATMSNSVNNPMCGTNNFGYLVTATYTFNLINYIFSVPLTATSCFPISAS
jgi:Flp pilus assembly protein TadG